MLTVELIWQKLNVQDPEVDFLQELRTLPANAKDELFSKYCSALLSDDPDFESAIMNWTRYAAVIDPQAYFTPILAAVKRMLHEADVEEMLDTYYYNSLRCFLDEHADQRSEEVLLDEWGRAELAEWRELLLGCLANARTKHPGAIQEMVDAWYEDPIVASFSLYEYPHPRLIEAAADYIEEVAPWYKYIWAHASVRSLDTMGWDEATDAWVRAVFPEEERQFDISMTPTEALENWINRLSGPGEIAADLLEKSDRQTRWRKDKIQRYFLSLLPTDWRDWLLHSSVTPEERIDFQQELAEAGLFKLGRISKNGPCPCGSGKKAKRCCHAD